MSTPDLASISDPIKEAKQRNATLAAIFTCIAIYGLTLGLGHPLISLILESRNVDSSLIGLTAAMPAFGMLLVAPAIPYLVRRFGLKKFLMTCFIADLVLFLMFPLFDNLYAWFAIRFLMGASTNGLMTASEAWVNEVAVDESRGRVLGLYNTIMAASVALGPMVIPFTGIVGWTPFLVGALFISVAIIPLARIRNASLDVHSSSGFNIFSFMILAPVIAFAVLLFSWKEFAGAAMLPVYGVRNGLATAEAAGMITVLGLGGVFLNYPIGWIADHFNRHAVLIGCGVGAALGALALPFSFDNHWLLWPLLFFWGGCFAGLYTIALVMIGQRFKGNELVTATVAIGVIWGLGSLTGPSITGVAMDIWDPQGFVGVFFIAASLFVLGALIRLIMTREKHNAL